MQVISNMERGDSRRKQRQLRSEGGGSGQPLYGKTSQMKLRKKHKQNFNCER